MSIHNCTNWFQELMLLLCFNIHKCIYLQSLNHRERYIIGTTTLGKKANGKKIIVIIEKRYTKIEDILDWSGFSQMPILNFVDPVIIGDSKLSNFNVVLRKCYVNIIFHLEECKILWNAFLRAEWIGRNNWTLKKWNKMWQVCKRN